MPPTPTSISVADISEPPSARSRYAEYALIEALAITCVDGKFTSLVCMIFGYSKSPFKFLLLAELLLVLIVLAYNPTALSFVLEQLTFTCLELNAPIVGLIIQGIGYFVAETIHYYGTKLITRHFCDAKFYALILKNSVLISLGAFGQIFATSVTMENFCYGAIYALIVGTLQDSILSAPYLQQMTITTSKYFHAYIKKSMRIINAYGFTWVPYLLIFLSIVVSGHMYAQSLDDTSVTILPSWITFFSSTVIFMEQTIIYEYAYRVAYRSYNLVRKNKSFIYENIQEALSYCTELLGIKKSSISF